jgi:predicted Fe-Mo cluster-binding NifX family protein
MVRSLGAQVIWTGSMGPGAVDMFHGFGIDVVTGVVGTVGKAVNAYLNGSIEGVFPCRHDHPDSWGRGRRSPMRRQTPC